MQSAQLLYVYDTKYSTTAVGGGATIAVAVVILVTQGSRCAIVVVAVVSYVHCERIDFVSYDHGS